MREFMVMPLSTSKSEEEIMRRIILACALAGILSAPVLGQGVDPLIGTWKLNLEKSTYIGSQLPKSQANTWSGEGQNFIDTVEGVNAQGQPFKFVYQHIYDGQPHPTTGSPNYDSTSYTRIGNTINIVRFRGGKAVEVGQGVIVPGKTFTVTTEGTNANNQPYHTVGVFDRQ
jgi:hypothetical protein